MKIKKNEMVTSIENHMLERIEDIQKDLKKMNIHIDLITRYLENFYPKMMNELEAIRVGVNDRMTKIEAKLSENQTSCQATSQEGINAAYQGYEERKDVDVAWEEFWAERDIRLLELRPNASSKSFAIFFAERVKGGAL